MTVEVPLNEVSKNSDLVKELETSPNPPSILLNTNISPSLAQNVFLVSQTEVHNIAQVTVSDADITESTSSLERTLLESQRQLSESDLKSPVSMDSATSSNAEEGTLLN